MNALEPANKPEITPIRVKKRQTGTQELSLIAKSLDNIHIGMTDFMSTINRSSKKESQIAARLCELRDVIIDTGEITEELQEILEDLDRRIFEEKFYTEKGGGNTIRMTDDTRLSHLRAFASEAAKVAGVKFKMSAGDYVPKETVIYKSQRTIDIFKKLANEHLGPVAGDALVKEAIDEICEVWDEG